VASFAGSCASSDPSAVLTDRAAPKRSHARRRTQPRDEPNQAGPRDCSGSNRTGLARLPCRRAGGFTPTRLARIRSRHFAESQEASPGASTLRAISAADASRLPSISTAVDFSRRSQHEPLPVARRDPVQLSARTESERVEPGPAEAAHDAARCVRSWKSSLATERSNRVLRTSRSPGRRDWSSSSLVDQLGAPHMQPCCDRHHDEPDRPFARSLRCFVRSPRCESLRSSAPHTHAVRVAPRVRTLHSNRVAAA